MLLLPSVSLRVLSLLCTEAQEAPAHRIIAIFSDPRGFCILQLFYHAWFSGSDPFLTVHISKCV